MRASAVRLEAERKGWPVTGGIPPVKGRPTAKPSKRVKPAKAIRAKMPNDPLVPDRYSDHVLARLGAEGKARDNGKGGFDTPIRDERDLLDALYTIGAVPTAELPAVKRWIVYRAQQLNLLLLVPREWVAEVKGAIAEANSARNADGPPGPGPMTFGAEHRREAVAYHEAGHAIIAHAWGYKDVSVDCNHERGRVFYTPPEGEKGTPAGRFRLLAQALGGMGAEVLRFGDLDPDLVYKGDKTDAGKLLDHWPAQERQGVLADAWIMAKKLLRERWPDVEWIAGSGKVSALVSDPIPRKRR
jgi:hypothetical protein